MTGTGDGNDLTLRGVCILVLVSFIWGLNFVVIHLGLRHFPPLLFSALRFLFCALPWIFIVPKPKISLRSLLSLGIVLGILVFVGLFVGMHEGVPAGIASLTMQAQVFFTVILGKFFLSEKPGPLQILSVFIGMFAIFAMIVIQGTVGTYDGIVLVLGGALSWGVANIMMKKLPRVNMLGLMVWISLIPPVPLFLMSIAVDGWPTVAASLRAFDASGFMAVAYTGLLSTIFAYGMWGSMLQRFPTTSVAPFALLVPVFALLTAYLFLGEHYTAVQLCASAVIIGALAANIWHKKIEKAILNKKFPKNIIDTETAGHVK
ncbi:EamA family transporter [Nguyenibacter vanlangensis]|uniref:EamA family transporter n=1 Tax=Nguyenibacter vanlangensis TaxID=1216886 RepID=A0ABZ3DAC3_9PROT